MAKDKCSNCEYCITEDGDKVCNNQNSEYYSDYVEPEHVCLDYEGKTMSVTDDILKTDYSLQFDEKRKALVVQSHYKYGRAGRNFATGNVDAIGSLEKCLAKFKETGNTEYLLDVANYAMFRYMWPQSGEYFKHTDSDESAGIVGMSVNEMEKYK